MARGGGPVWSLAKKTIAKDEEAMMMLTQAVHRTFSFYLLPDFSLQAFSCAIEVLRLANEAIGRKVYSWQVISADGQPVISSCRLTVSIDSTLRNERDRTLTSRGT